MSVQLTKECCLESSANSVFYKKPVTLKINEELKTRYATSQKIETLIEELKEKGPLIGLGKIGPAAYSIEPKIKYQLHGQVVLGWQKNSPRIEYSKSSYLMILGAKKSDDMEHVYFTLSEDITPNSDNYKRIHSPSSKDVTIYVVSHKTFQNYLTDLYPPNKNIPVERNSKSIFFVSSKPNKEETLSTDEYEYVKRLSAIYPLDSILDRGEGEKACKAIGQEIFDKYKSRANGNSIEGQMAVQKICNAILSAKDGSLRRQYIERAWDGIGDNNWQWRS